MAASASSRASECRVVGLVSGGKDSFYSLHLVLSGILSSSSGGGGGDGGDGALGDNVTSDHHPRRRSFPSKFCLACLANVAPCMEPPQEGGGITHSPTASSSCMDGASEEISLACDDAATDLDSYMFQSIGHNVIEAYASMMQVPLLRRTSAMKRKNDSLSYVPTQGDEVEDLAKLLVAARVRYHATHACCGAILSDYQRVRFENACTVAKLVPLAPMWQRSQRRLLKEMVRDGLDAAVVKVAALGLDPTKHLGKTIAQLAPHLDRLEREYGVHSCGEGGEYETIVLAFPALFREARLHVTKARATPPPHAAGDGVVGAWVVDAFEVIGASTEAGEACAVSQVNDHDDDDAMQPPPAATVNGKDAAEMRADVRVGTWRSKHSLHICATAPMRGDDDDDAVQAALDAASKAARSAGVADGLGSAYYVTFCVPRMSRFADVNKHYAGHMPACDPPARCCLEMAGGAASCAVEVSFPAPLSKLAQMLAAKAPPGSVRPARDVMHVQSISPWAPSCIGPYAQMNRALGFRHYAGVIALDPWSMELVHVPSGNIEEQASLEARRVFASLHALYRRHGRDVLRDTFAAVAYTSGASADDAPNRVMQALDLVQDGLVHGAVDTRFVDALRSHAGLARPWDSDDDDDDDDDYDNGMEEEGEEEVRPYAKSLSKSHPPSLMLVADVGALPRGARFELIVNALDESWEGGDDDDDDDDDDDGDGAINVDSRRRARYMVAEDSFAGAFVRLRGGSAAACTTYAWCTPEEIASVGWSACASAAMQRALSRLPWRGLTSSDATHIRVYATVEVGSTEECDIREGLGDRANALIVACRALGTRVRGLKKSIGLAVEMHAIVM